MLILETSDEDDIVVATESLAHNNRRMTVRIYRPKPRRTQAGRKVGPRTQKIFHDPRFIPRSLHALIISARTTP